ncbi:MAG: DUF4974 domain-containing protein [Muribaculaceae bacterium]|nr:DUF4974 domain-containing protein [Muribaculaceae bacterium]
MEQKRIQYLISTSLDNKLTIEERFELMAWLHSTEADSDCRKVWNETDAEIDKMLSDEIWSSVKSEISPVPKLAIPSKFKMQSTFIRRFKIVATICAIVCSSVLLSVLYGDNISALWEGDAKIYSFEVQSGQKASMQLADGTVVWLNSASKLTFDDNYNDDDRIVNLEGEAYFDVAKNQNKKFVVKCNGVEVEALGTSFNVKAYLADGYITTTLAKGKVKVSSEKEDVYLSPSEQAIYNIKDKEIRKDAVSNIALADFWLSDSLVFDGVTLESLSHTIERMYGVKIMIRDKSLNNVTFTGTIKNNSLPNIFHLISLTYPLKYSMEGDTIWIYK